MKKVIDARKLVAVSVSGLVIASAIFGCSPDDENAACKADLACLAPKFADAASAACKPQIEQWAQFDVYNDAGQPVDSAQAGIEFIKWDAGVEQIFSSYGWTVSRAGQIYYLGNKAQFLTPSGKYERLTYRCDFDTAKNSVIAVDAFER